MPCQGLRERGCVLPLVGLLVALGGCHPDLPTGGPEGPVDGAAALDLVAEVPDLAASDLRPCPGSTDLADWPLGPMVLEAPTTLGPRNSRLLAVADVDRDGRADLVTDYYYGVDRRLEVRFGIRGGFAPPTEAWQSMTRHVVAVAVGDLDRDGWPDLVAVTAPTLSLPKGQSLGVLVVRGAPARAFGAATEVAIAADQGWALALGDFDADGALDVAALAGTAGEVAGEKIVLLRGKGDGSLVAASTTGLAPYYGVTSPLAADWDGDGKLDLVLGAYGLWDGRQTLDGGALLFAGNGDGTFAPPVVIALPGARVRVVSVAGADLDADRRPDLIVTTFGGTLATLLAKGDGTFGAPAWTDLHGVGGSVAAADFDGDGRLDLAVEEEDAVDVALLPGLGNGSFGPARRQVSGDLRWPQFREDVVQPLHAGDLDGDGAADVALSGAGVGWGPVVLRGRGDGTLEAGSTHDAGRDAIGLALGDLDRDGRADFASVAYPGLVAVSLGAADRQARKLVVSAVGGNFPFSIAAGHLDRDGILDLVVGDLGTPTDRGVTGAGVSVLTGRGDGSFAAPARVDTGARPAFALAVADLDGDGVDDVATANLEAGSASVLLARGGALGPPVDYPVGDTAYSIAAADLDGDGALDLAVAVDPLDAPGGQVAVLHGDGRGGFGPARSLATDVGTPRVVLAGDVDGDRRPDLVVVGEWGYAQVLLARCDGGFDAQPPMKLDDSGYHLMATAAALADLDGNGAPELLVASAGDDPELWRCFERCMSPGVLVLAGLGSGRFGAPQILGAGDTPDGVGAIDADGDGRPDLVVTNRGGTHSLYLNRAR